MKFAAFWLMFPGMIGENLDPNQPRDLSPMRYAGACASALYSEVNTALPSALIVSALPLNPAAAVVVPAPLPAAAVAAAQPSETSPPWFPPAPRKRRLVHAL